MVVPNVSWGWKLRYEADLIAISSAGCCVEIEIKVNKYDLLNDNKKEKWQNGLDKRISRFYYAVPVELKDLAIGLAAPKGFGVVVVKPGRFPISLPVAEIVLSAQKIPKARKPSQDEIVKLLHLGVMRYWDIRTKELS
jgi:hypothetical protein